MKCKIEYCQDDRSNGGNRTFKDFPLQFDTEEEANNMAKWMTDHDYNWNWMYRVVRAAPG